VTRILLVHEHREEKPQRNREYDETDHPLEVVQKREYEIAIVEETNEVLPSDEPWLRHTVPSRETHDESSKDRVYDPDEIEG
jgi:hypothetical protein